ncbi:hypothetical protein PSECIP111854_02881 [Pseudoalteromonas sp. CIP111854]|uniref:Uncharacterized protein n=1 Tax=Pseudoalteromonas holothuriae TaxID=2963714 RepID=A0A9W4R0T0_9GAMM|nr:hypothetical protein [Pseudoalteromonas sp. CIP111854]CAH9061792.1 hypothetical protein PSECIP111854_02881 [Pseudoalteromonas sp. CIP111854]
MKNVEDEVVARLVLFKLDFQEAKECLVRAKTEKDKFIRDSLIKLGIVTYAKPFLKSNGVHKPVKRFYLFKNEVVPEEYLWLHEMLMDYRGNYIGHSNFNSIKPEVPKDSIEEDGVVNIMNFMAVTYDHWFILDAEYSDKPLLIDEAIALVSAASNFLPGDQIQIRR